MTRRHANRTRRFYNELRRMNLLCGCETARERANWPQFNTMPCPLTDGAGWERMDLLPPPRFRSPRQRREHARDLQAKRIEHDAALHGWR